MFKEIVVFWLRIFWFGEETESKFFSSSWQSEPPSPRSSSPSSALAAAVNGMSKAAIFKDLGPESASMTSGNFFEALTTSEFYKNTKVVYNLHNFCFFLMCFTFLFFNKNWWHSLSSKHTGTRHRRVISLGSIPCSAEIQLLLDHASVAFKVQNEEHSCSWFGWRDDW